MNNLRISIGKSLFLFLCWWILCAVLGSILIGFVGGNTVSSLRWATIVQDFTMFLLPVAMTVILISGRPLEFIEAKHIPSSRQMLLAFGIMLFSLPAMNWLVDLNESIVFPESMHELENALRTSEEMATSMVERMMSGTNISDLFISILIIGVLTGIAEETFFRGLLQNMLRLVIKNHHVAIWATAIIFSVMHLQFYGLFPRILMGAFFGYLAWWSHSLWLPIIMHAANNSIVVINTWLNNTGYTDGELDQIGVGQSFYDLSIVVISIIATGVGLWLFSKRYKTVVKN